MGTKAGDWPSGGTCVIAAASGAVLALHVGDIEKAKKIYQAVLRSDPDQAVIKSRYKVLRTFMKMHSDIEELLRNSKNHDVVKAVDRCRKVLQEVIGEDASVSAGTRLLLFECKSKSAMKFHDIAIEACNTAISQFENHDNPEPRHIAEAHAWRAEAEMVDRSYDDAVADLEIALKKVPNSQDYEEKLREAKQAQAHWSESEEQYDRRRQSIGHFPKNRPWNELLDLPDNIEELEQEDKCRRLKKGFHRMSLRWHPDKATGGKKRAQRKTAEITEAKAFLELKWGCKQRRR